MQRSRGGGRVGRPVSTQRPRRQSPGGGGGGGRRLLPPPPPAAVGGGGDKNHIPPPPQFKPPPLPEEDDGVFIRPIGRSRSPHLQIPEVPPVSLSPIGEVDTPESSRSVSPSSMMSQSSSSSRAYSPAPFVITHDSFIRSSSPSNASGPPKWRRPSPARTPPATAEPPPEPAVLKPVQNVVPPDGPRRPDGVKPPRKDTPAVVTSIPRMELEPPTPVQARQKENTDQKRATQEADDFDEPTAKASKFDIDGKFHGSNFKRRQSKKIKINREKVDDKETLKVPSAEDEINLDDKNLTAKEEHVIREVLNARRSRSRSPNSEASMSTESLHSSISSNKKVETSNGVHPPNVKNGVASTDVEMTPTEFVASTEVKTADEGSAGGIFVPDCVENIADLTVEHVKYMSETKLNQADIGELGDYYESVPIENVPKITVDKAETTSIPQNLTKVNVKGEAIIDEVDKMYEDIDTSCISPIPQPKKVAMKETENKLKKASKTLKDAAITDMPDTAMEAQEKQFNQLAASRATEQKASPQLQRAGRAPQPGLVTDLYESVEVAKDRAPDDQVHEYEAVMKSVQNNRSKAKMAPANALVGDVDNRFETAVEQQVSDNGHRESAKSNSEPSRLSKAKKSTAKTASLGAQNVVNNKLEETQAFSNKLSTPKLAQKNRVTSPLRKASNAVKDTTVTDLGQEFSMVEETADLNTATADAKTYSAMTSVVSGTNSFSKAEPVAVYEDVQQPAPRTKKKPAVTQERPSVAAAAAVIQPARTEPARRQPTSSPERPRERKMYEETNKASSEVTLERKSGSGIITWILPSILAVVLYWLFQMWLAKSIRPPSDEGSLDDYSYFNILRWP